MEILNSILSTGYAIYFLGITLFGAAGLVFFFVLGEFFEADHADHADLDHDHPSFLSVRVLLLFTTGFGGGGFAVANTSRIGLPLTLLCAVIGGLLTSYVGYRVFRFFGQSQATTSINPASLTGMTAVVTLPIYPNSVGEICFTTAGGNNYLTARSATGKAYPVNETVTIASVNGRLATVRDADTITIQTKH